jgi:hypothetical protein
MDDVQNLLFFLLAELMDGLRTFGMRAPIFAELMLAPTLQGSLSQSKFLAGKVFSCTGLNGFFNQRYS